jgi:hypothetical protein
MSGDSAFDKIGDDVLHGAGKEGADETDAQTIE